MSVPVIMPRMGDTWWVRVHQVRTPGPRRLCLCCTWKGEQASHAFSGPRAPPLGWYLPSLPDWAKPLGVRLAYGAWGLKMGCAAQGPDGREDGK